jgi:hypothetical protein
MKKNISTLVISKIPSDLSIISYEVSFSLPRAFYFPGMIESSDIKKAGRSFAELRFTF